MLSQREIHSTTQFSSNVCLAHGGTTLQSWSSFLPNQEADYLILRNVSVFSTGSNAGGACTIGSSVTNDYFFSFGGPGSWTPQTLIPLKNKANNITFNLAQIQVTNVTPNINPPSLAPANLGAADWTLSMDFDVVTMRK